MNICRENGINRWPIKRDKYMWYEVHILDVGDADAIVIKYRATEQSPLVTAVIDAGNVGDGQKVLDCIGKLEDEKYHIDYAFCTHPDKDHKGGLFDLMQNKQVTIVNLALFDPWTYLNVGAFASIKSEKSARIKARAPFNSPTGNQDNLIDLAISCQNIWKIRKGCVCQKMPLRVIGPSEAYYKQCAIGMSNNFAEVVDDPDFEAYDEDAIPDETSARSVIDEDDDTSITNRSSMILLFEPPGGSRFLLPGDANCASLKAIIDECGEQLRGCTLKVPHHGSKHNLTTEIIDSLAPRSAVISAKGSKKHPSSAIVYWLSRHCNVYSTHKSKGLVYGSNINGNATPLREKIKS